MGVAEKLGVRITGRRIRYLALAGLDVLSATGSLALALFLRMNGHIPPAMLDGLVTALPVVALVSVIVFHLAGLYSHVWRYMSATALPAILVAAGVAIGASTLMLAAAGRAEWLPTSVPIIQWFVLVAGLAGARLARRLVADHLRGRRAAEPAGDGVAVTRRRALLIGSGDRVEVALRQIESNPSAGLVAVGILDDVAGHLALKVRGVPVLGDPDALAIAVKRLEVAGQRPDCILLVDDPGRLVGASLVRLVGEAESLGLTVSRLPVSATPEKASADGVFTPLDFATLLGRAPRIADTAGIANFVAHQRVMVTGAGGTIGRELVNQIAAAGPSEIILLDACEFNLYSIDQELFESYPHIQRAAVLCSIRQRGNLMNVFAKYRPNLVFHAAALKHVPLVEANACSGIQTNVLGTRNVADAAKRYGARAMVQVSTDKAVNPVGIMGASKRLGELYCQALDLVGIDKPVQTRFLTVRFGNVVGSSGSLIPLFQRQLSRRVPLTVTHPKIRRYFMTVHEAVHLILQGAAHALQHNSHHGLIFVLDMGEPIPIIDIARRMIRLAGLVPDKDVQIDIVGLRPGEKLYEELFDSTEKRLASSLPGIFAAEPVSIELSVLNAIFDRLAAAAATDDAIAVRAIVTQLLRSGPLSADCSTAAPDIEVAVPATPVLAQPILATATFESART
ncbi:polysaccharide biosynthesis protein [Sandarakinorhabdus glacialis]|nr:nucleoside-diphosphate sugar epimerase/dehydratase [Polymorphobacter glacialis]